jgi:hypothetical protein
MEKRRVRNKCQKQMSASSGNSTLAKHLKRHNIVASSDNSTSCTTGRQIVQSTLDFSKHSAAGIHRFDSSVAKYISMARLSHRHGEQEPFQVFIAAECLGHKPKSARSVKRMLLRMYVVLRQMLEDLWKSNSYRFNITFDGWSNQNLKGF